MNPEKKGFPQWGGLGDPSITTLSLSIKVLPPKISKNNMENNSILFLNNSVLLKIPITTQPPRGNPERDTNPISNQRQIKRKAIHMLQ